MEIEEVRAIKHHYGCRLKDRKLLLHKASATDLLGIHYLNEIIAPFNMANHLITLKSILLVFKETIPASCVV